MDKITKFFLTNSVRFAGVYSDKGLLSESNIPFDELVKTATVYGYECIDLGQSFVVAKARYC